MSVKVKNFLEGKRSRRVMEIGALILIFISLGFAVYFPWKNNAALYKVLRLNSQGEISAKDYTRLLNEDGIGFPEALEHISLTAKDLAVSGASPDIRDGILNTIDKAFLRYIDAVPNDVRFRFFYGKFLADMKKHGQALDQLREAHKLAPQKQGIMYELVSNYMALGNSEEAVQIAKTAYDLDNSNWEARFIYGLTLWAFDNKVLSEEILSPIPESDIVFDDRTLLTFLAVKKYQEIIKISKRRIELDPLNRQHHITLTAAYLEAGRRDEAIAVLQGLIKADPSFKEKGEYFIAEIRAGRRP